MNFLTGFNEVDVVALILMLAGLLQGFHRGTFSESLSFISALLILFIGLMFFQPFSEILTNNTNLFHEEQAESLAFFMIVFVVWTSLVIVRMLFHLVFKIARAKTSTSLKSGLLGMMRGALVASIFIFGIGLWPDLQVRDMFCEASFVGRNICRIAIPSVKKLNDLREPLSDPVHDLLK